MNNLSTYINEKLKINKNTKTNSLQTSIEEAISNYLLDELNYKDFKFEFLNLPTERHLGMFIHYNKTINSELEFRKKYFYKIEDIIIKDLKLKVDSGYSDLGDNGKYPQKIYISIKY